MTKSSLNFSNINNKIIINCFINEKPYKKIFNTTFKRIKKFKLFNCKHNIVKCKKYSIHHLIYGYYYENFRKTNDDYKRTLKYFSKNVGYKHKTEYTNSNKYLYKILYLKVIIIKIDFKNKTPLIIYYYI